MQSARKSETARLYYIQRVVSVGISYMFAVSLNRLMFKHVISCSTRLTTVRLSAKTSARHGDRIRVVILSML